MSSRAKLIFTLSVILNILFVGAGIGVATHFPKDPPFPAEMSPKARAFMKETFQAGRGEIGPMIEEIKRKRSGVESILTAPDFDAAAYGKAANDMLDTRDRISRKKAEIMGRALASVPTGDRRDYAKYILDGLEGRPKVRHGDGKPGEGCAPDRSAHDRKMKGVEDASGPAQNP